MRGQADEQGAVYMTIQNWTANADSAGGYPEPRATTVFGPSFDQTAIETGLRTCDANAEAAALRAFVAGLSRSGRALLLATLRRQAADQHMPPYLRSDIAALIDDLASVFAELRDPVCSKDVT
ncbi:hypothetical protein [Falsiroseomonas sp. HW251]|uniref:hypothetical protein n=1 Tax=Falsiroseomonas sp. HW251 TaxID=3390998 RepID=UPI003D30F407